MNASTDSNRLTTSSSVTADLASPVLRIALGTVFLAHAYAKAAIFTFAGTEQYFAGQGLPSWTVYPVFAIELTGGALLWLGYRTRAVSLALVPVMLGALVVHASNGWMFTASGGGWEYVAFLTAALVAQALLGDGAFALSSLGARGGQVPTAANAEGMVIGSSGARI
jgi:putative oxidoreductase